MYNGFQRSESSHFCDAESSDFGGMIKIGISLHITLKDCTGYFEGATPPPICIPQAPPGAPTLVAYHRTHKSTDHPILLVAANQKLGHETRRIQVSLT